MELVPQLKAHSRSGEHERALEVIEQMLAIDPQHPTPYQNMVTIYVNSGDYATATALLESRGVDGPGRDYGLAYLAALEKRGEDAERLYGSAIEQYAAIDHLAGSAYAHQNFGWFLGRQKRYAEAREMASSARPMFAELRYPIGESTVLRDLGQIEWKLGQYDQGIVYYEQALKIEFREERKDRASASLHWIGKCHRNAGRPEDAIEFLERAVSIRRELGDAGLEGSSLYNLGLAQVDLGDAEAATGSFQASLAIAERFARRDFVAIRQLALGKALSSVGRTEEAIESLEIARALSKELGHRTREVRANLALGYAFVDLGKLSAAAQRLEAGLELSRKLSGRRLKAAILAELASVYFDNGRFGQALIEQRRALDLHRDGDDADEILSDVIRLGAIYHRLGDLDRAWQYYDEALIGAIEQQDPAIQGRALNNQSVILAHRGRLDEALALQRRSIELASQAGDRRGVAFRRHNAADLLWRQAKRDEATKLLESALDELKKVGDRTGETLALNLWAGFQLQRGEPKEALKTLDTSLTIASNHGLRRQVWSAHLGRASVYEAMKRPARAVAAYESALEIIESLRAGLEIDSLKTSYIEDKTDIYERVLFLQAQMEKTTAGAPSAFVLAERARARSLVDLLTESHTGSIGGLTELLVERETEKIDSVGAALRRLTEAKSDDQRGVARLELARAEEDLQQFKLELRRTAPRYSEIAYPEPVTLDEIRRQVLRPNETLLRYFVGRESSALWVVRRDGATFHSLPPPERIESMVSGFLERAGRAGVSVGERVPGQKEASGLARALLPGSIQPGHRLIVVPDGPLHRLPFDGLRRGDRYLIEDHEIVVVPSASTLQVMRRKPTGGGARGFLGVGAPPGDGDPRFPALSEPTARLDRIAAFFPEQHRQVLKGKTATKAAFRKQPLDRYRFIHFATHGWLDPERPRYYGLRLGSGSEDADGEFLYPDDVFSLRLKADMVVLAACRSGQGELLRGEGLVGMTRGFLYAGARSVLVSLWDINDRSTGEFMESFYKEVAAGRSVAEALRLTKLRFIRSDRPAQRQPYRWAPFVLVGDPPISDPKMNPGTGTSTSLERAGGQVDGNDHP